MQHASSDPPIFGKSGFNLLNTQHTRGFFVGAFDLKETCNSFSKLKPALPGMGGGGSEDTCCIKKKSCIMSTILQQINFCISGHSKK